MSVMIFKKKEQRTLVYDGSSLEKAIPFDSVIPTGTSGMVSLIQRNVYDMYSGGYKYIAVMLEGGKTWTISSNIGMEGTCRLVNFAEAKVGEVYWSMGDESNDWQEGVAPITFTPAETGLYYIYMENMFSIQQDLSVSSGSDRPLSYTPPTLSQIETSSGFGPDRKPLRYFSTGEALIAPGGPSANGLLLYHPMTEMIETLSTGQTVTYTGVSSGHFGMYHGFPGFRNGDYGGNYITLPRTTLPSALSFSFWIYFESDYIGGHSGRSNIVVYENCQILMINNNNNVELHVGNDDGTKYLFAKERWYHVTVVYRCKIGEKSQIYIDGNLVTEYTATRSLASDMTTMNNTLAGGRNSYNDELMMSCSVLAGFRIYGRALSQMDAIKLGREDLTASASGGGDGSGGGSGGAPCLLKGTMISLANGLEKPIEEVTYDDELLVWDFDNGCNSSAKPIWIMKPAVTNCYYLNTYSDGKILKTVGQTGTAHRHFCVGTMSFKYTNHTVGSTIYGKDCLLYHNSCELVEDECEYYNIVTDRHINMFANGILTSCRLNNMYSIKGMKYLKDFKKDVDASIYDGIPEKYITGLRLLEQPENMRDYVLNMLEKAL